MELNNTILTSVWRSQHPNAGRNIQQIYIFLLNFAANLLLFKRFYSHLAQKMLKITISTSVLGGQHSNAGQNIQQLWDSDYSTLILCWTLFFLFLAKILPAQVIKRKICILCFVATDKTKNIFWDTSKSGKRHAQICLKCAAALFRSGKLYKTRITVWKHF